MISAVCFLPFFYMLGFTSKNRSTFHKRDKKIQKLLCLLFFASINCDVLTKFCSSHTDSTLRRKTLESHSAAEKAEVGKYKKVRICGVIYAILLDEIPEFKLWDNFVHT